ncbi:3-methyl-2-oxobutanoate hydroxymethyltransferase [Candidatus Pelagibacter sp.]|uniref:3-methyl-2-oxobutanoate hydroxymethyltransferase n=1 Tax=Candidatus Pelagibacter sp. TaxID=2024849 RepID=UPI003F84AC13
MKKIKNLLIKKNKTKIVCLTAYSKNIAQEIDNFVDIILVGDSLGSVLYDFNTTRSVTLEMMINHSKSVRKGITKSLMVVDMPYNTYRNKSEALKNCKKVTKETKCDAVKLEGGNKKIVEIIKHLIKNKIPVMGHIGLLPQNEKGKFTFKGKSSKEKLRLLNEAKVLERAGVFAIVLECVEKKLSKEITDQIKIITIGIGASQHCDGQILVTDDLIGLTNSKIKFVKEFGNVRKTIRDAVKKYKTEVKSLKYPSKKYLY